MSEGRSTRLPKISLARDLPRWGLAAAVAVGAHAAVAAGVVAFAPGEPPPALQKAMTIELAPLIVNQAEPAEDEVETVAALEPEEILEEEPPATEEEVVETIEEEPEEVSEEVVEEEPQEVVEEEIEEVKPAPVVKKAEVVLPKPAKKKPERKVEKKPVKKVEAKKSEKRVEKRIAKAETTQRARRSASTAPSASEVSRWKARLNATVARRTPRKNGMQGRATVQFYVSRSGSVASSRIVGSSGNAAIDSAALAVVRGGFPAPPAGLDVASSPITLTVRFN